MKSLVVALFLGSVSPTYLNRPSIWDESTEETAADICSDHWARWSDSSNSKKTYKQALRSTDVWSDPFFAANMDMVYSKTTPPANGQTQVDFYEKYIKGWKRPQEIYPEDGNPTLYGDYHTLTPKGIKQGSLSDCWFLAGATALAEDPKRMNRVVHRNSRDSYNPQGIFRYYFWNYKKWVKINIDDRLPAKYKYSNSDKYFAPFASDRSTHGAWWMPLLEKAYSKLNGDYDRIEWGSGYESLRQLSGKPTYFFKHAELKKLHTTEDALFGLFHRMHQENYPMVISCCGASKTPDGLVGNHAYTLLDVIDLDGHKLAKIRNPWSKEGYNGKWSDKDTTVWTKDRLVWAEHKLADDGVFFMPFHQFLSKDYFRSTTVAIHQKFTKEQIFEVSQTVQQISITINVPSKQKIYFTFEKENPRFEKNCKKDQTHINFYLFKGTTFQGMDKLIGPLGYMGGSMYHSTLAAPDQVFEKGTYTIMVANWGQDKSGNVPYTLKVYQEGSGKVGVSY